MSLPLGQARQWRSETRLLVFLRACDDTGGEGVTIQVWGIRGERAASNTGGGQRPVGDTGGGQAWGSGGGLLHSTGGAHTLGWSWVSSLVFQRHTSLHAALCSERALLRREATCRWDGLES